MMTKFKKVTIALCALMSSVTFAAEGVQSAAQNLSAPQKVWEHLKSTVSLSYHGEYLFSRKDIYSQNSSDHDLKDFYWMHNPTIIYRPIENWRFLVTSEFKYFDSGKKSSYINRHYRSLVSVARENVLTEMKDGIKLDLGVARRIVDQKAPGVTYGSWRFTTNIRKTFSPTFTAGMFSQILISDPKEEGKSKPNMWNYGYEFIPNFTWQITEKFAWAFSDDITIYTPRNSGQKEKVAIIHDMNLAFLSYQFNTKNSAYLQIKYYHNVVKNFQGTPGNKTDQFSYYVGYTYAFTPKISLTTEVGNILTKNGDQKDLFAKEAKYPDVLIYFDWRL